MPIEFKCPTCRSSLRAQSEYAGKIGKCKQCKSKFTIPSIERQETIAKHTNNHPPKARSSYHEQLKQFHFPQAVLGRRIDDFPESDARAIFEWGMRMYGLSTHAGGTIEEIKYEGHVVILDNGRKWEVDDSDTYIAESWLEGDRVVIIDGRMYQIDESESAEVREI